MTSEVFYGLSPDQINDVGRALWQSWRHGAAPVLRISGGRPVPAIVAIEAAVVRLPLYGGAGTMPETLRFVREHSPWHCLDVARAAGYFVGDSIGL